MSEPTSPPPTGAIPIPNQGVPSQAASSRLNNQPSTGSLRGAAPPPQTSSSPRTPSRHPSISGPLSSGAIADLLSSPPPKADGAHYPKDWREVKVKEIITDQKLKFVYQDTTVESACHELIEHGISSVPVLDSPEDETVVGTFDYSDLTAFLLLMVGLYKPESEDEDEISSFQDLATKARTGNSIPVKLVKDLGKKAPLITVAESETLARAIEILGSGVHRIAVTEDGGKKVVGVLSQLALVRFFWENARHFPHIESIFVASLQQLNIGSSNVISIHGDKKVSDALSLMNSEGISSLCVIDNEKNVVGNISTADVKYLTRASSIPLLKTTCLHFLSVILNDRGINDGKDSYPVFHVTQQSTLSHTIAKLVATKSHRMWLVESPSPGSSGPPTPALSHSLPVSSGPPTHIPQSPLSLPGARLGGQLVGVVSLTDILNTIARSVGLTPGEPQETRRRRRSSSVSTRTSVDFARSLGELRR